VIDNSANVESRNDYPTSKCKHVFVSGPPRAGTTLLRFVLSAHPKITITPETRFIQQLFAKGLAPQKRLSQDAMASVVQLMRFDAKLSSWPAFDLDDFLDNLSTHRGMTVGQLLDHLFQTFAEQTNSGTDYLGNKKGLYAQGYGPYTKQVFPDAKFVYIVRDPRDVTRSVVKNLSGYSSVEAAATCSDRNRHMIRMRELFPDDVLVVRYEDLISEPEQVCRSMCDFLGIPFDEQMLTFYKMNRDGSRLIGVTKDIHQHTTTPFNPNLIGQWKKKRCFTAKELQTIEAIARDYMNRYGYEPEALSGGITAMVIRLKVFSKFWYRRARRAIARRKGELA